MNLSQRRTYQRIIIATIGICFLFASLTWGNYRYSKGNPGGNDFMVHWMGTRMLVLDGISPYSETTARAIQTFAYGRPAVPGEHELRVAYPLYSIIVFLPFSLIENYPLARALWMTFMELSLFLLAYLSVRLTNWKPSILNLVIFLVFSTLGYHSMRPLINGNVVILVAALQVGALLSIKNRGDELGGVLLAFSTIKPQLSILLILFIIFWAFRHGRRKVFLWFILTMGLLTLSTMLLIPDWIIQNFYEIIRYTEYNPPVSLQTALAEMFPTFGSRIGWAITGILSLILLYEWVILNNKSFRHFLWAALLTILSSQMIGIPTDPGNFILFLPVIVLLFEAWDRRWGALGRFISIIIMVILLIAIWVLFLNTIQPGYQPQQSPVMFIPLPLFLLIMIYWARWWILQPDERISEQMFEDNDPYQL